MSPPSVGPEAGERVRRLGARLRAHPAGMHRLAEPAVALDAELPESVAAVYRELGPASLFFDAIVLRPPASLRAPRPRDDGKWHVCEASGDDVYVDGVTGIVWRVEADTGEWVEEGTSFDRWLAGAVDAEAVLYDDSGEFREEMFDEAGELSNQAAIARERAALKRDKNAIGPRWRLARALARGVRGSPPPMTGVAPGLPGSGHRSEQLTAARDELERVVELRPSFGWAWFDLARLAERLGEPEIAREDMSAAAEADPEYEHAAYFWAHVARLSRGEDRRRAAARALELDPDLLRAQRDGAAERLSEGDIDGARELAQLAAALAPRDLAVIDLLDRIGKADI